MIPSIPVYLTPDFWQGGRDFLGLLPGKNDSRDENFDGILERKGGFALEAKRLEKRQ